MRPDVIAVRLRNLDALCFVASPGLQYYQQWARDNGGQWFQIGPTMDTSALRQLLRSLVRDVASVAKAVHQVGGGSVRRYLELRKGDQ